MVLFFCLSVFTLEADESVLLSLRVFPQDYQVFIQENQILPSQVEDSWSSYEFQTGQLLDGRISVRAEGFIPRNLTLDPSFLSDPMKNEQGQIILEEECKLERLSTRLIFQGIYPSGSQPKSVHFSPQGDDFWVALLNGTGINHFSSHSPYTSKQISLPNSENTSKGFVEFATVESRNELWVSQMTRGAVHILSLDTLEYKTSIFGLGTWSKVILVNEEETRAFISNWVSEDIAVVDIASREIIARLETDGIPRGMSFNADGSKLYVAIFEPSGNIEVWDPVDFERTNTWNYRGAKRHMVLDAEQNRLYVSDMAFGDIWIFDLNNEELIDRVEVGPKLNTIALSQDGRYLFISSRGTNNPETYLIKGPDFGSMYVLDTSSLEIVDWAYGMNQPTGLDLSHIESMVVFSDFLDHQIEMYDFSGLLESGYPDFGTILRHLSNSSRPIILGNDRIE